VLVFLGLKPGMQAADLMTKTGYWAEIMGLVVGPKGHVTALSAEHPSMDAALSKSWDELLAREESITLTHYPWGDFTAPANTFDSAILSRNYHDLYWESTQYRIPMSIPVPTSKRSMRR
jgi:predicted methyltransferase